MNMPMPSRFIPNANDCQMVSEGRADELSRSDKQRILFDIPEALRFRIDLRQCLALLKGDLYTRQRQSQGDDMPGFSWKTIVEIPSVKYPWTALGFSCSEALTLRSLS